MLCWEDYCEGTPTPHTTQASSTQTTVVCLPGKEWQSCGYKCTDVCNYRAMKAGACEDPTVDDCVPGCMPINSNVTCNPHERLNEHGMCIHEQMCPCLKPDGTPSKPMETWPNPDAPCSRCSCLKNQIVCGHDPTGCGKTPVPTPVSASPTTPTVCGWTHWMNVDNPKTGDGDSELIQFLKLQYGFCSTPLAIECRDAITKTDSKHVHQQVTCSVTEGLKCFNYNNNGKCSDYEIRVFCPCTSSTPSTKVTTAGPSTTIKTLDCGWTGWMSNHANSNAGDIETIPRLRRSYKFCDTDDIINIQCRDKATNETLSDDDSDIVCDIYSGLVCFNSLRTSKCPDFEVRFMCDPIGSDCSLIEPTPGPTPTPTVTIPGGPTTTAYTPTGPQPVCTEELGLGDGRIPDSRITASSFRDSMHSPKYVRFRGPSSWMPYFSNENQFIQVDFGVGNVVVTGIKTQGNAAAGTFVKEFKVLHSEDGTTWNTVKDKNNQDEIFHNKDGLPTTSFFDLPVRARFVRVMPIRWQGLISMKMEIIGCPYTVTTPGIAEVTTTPSTVITTTVTTTEKPHIQTTIPPTYSDKCVEWHPWLDLHRPSFNDTNDNEPVDDLHQATPGCSHVMAIECRTATPDHTPYKSTGQDVECNTWNGLKCVSDKSGRQMCYDYEARIGCLKQIPECLHPPPEIQTCYPGMDTTHCPKAGCAVGFYCNGTECVRKSDCPCILDKTVISVNGVIRGKACETCQCLNGDVICIPKVCPTTDCPQGFSGLNATTCDCQCDTCSPLEYQCGNGACIPEERRCDGVVDCLDDELGCATSTTPSIPGVTTRTGSTASSAPTVTTTVIIQNATLSSSSPTASTTPSQSTGTTGSSSSTTTTVSTPTTSHPVTGLVWSSTRGFVTTTVERNTSTSSHTTSGQTTSTSPPGQHTTSTTHRTSGPTISTTLHGEETTSTTHRTFGPTGSTTPHGEETTSTTHRTFGPTGSTTPLGEETTSTTSFGPTGSTTPHGEETISTTHRTSGPTISTTTHGEETTSTTPRTSGPTISTRSHGGETTSTTYRTVSTKGTTPGLHSSHMTSQPTDSTSTHVYSTSTEDQCARVTCPPLGQFEMKEGVTVTLTKTADGCCQKYKVCDTSQCPRPSSNCSVPHISVPETGKDCCPDYHCECPAACPTPPPPTCETGFTPHKIPLACNCSTFVCLPIPDGPQPMKCYYTAVEHYATKSGEMSYKIVKSVDVNTTWSDGPCKSCSCVLGDGKTHPEVLCTETQCKTCKKGEKLVKKSGACCGECVPDGCVVNGTVYADGGIIPSTTKCRNKTCEKDNFGDGYIIKDSQVSCPDIQTLPPCNDTEDSKDADGCCPKCIPPMPGHNRTSHCNTCSPQLVFGNSALSVGYFKIKLPSGVSCLNRKPLKDLKECTGYCKSESKYTSLMQGFENSCQCCQAEKTTSHSVKLSCSDGSTITKLFKMPTSCACKACSGKSPSTKTKLPAPKKISQVPMSISRG